MNTIANNTNEKNNTFHMCGNANNMQEAFPRHHHRRGPGGHGCRGAGGHGGPGHKGKKWVRLIKNLVQQSKVNAEEIHEYAQAAGLKMPIDFIKARFAEGEHKGHKHHHEGGRPDFGANKPWLRIVEQLMKAKNITTEELSAMATEAGMQVPKAFIEKKLAKINEKEGERSGSSSGSRSPRRHGGRPMMKVLKQFLKAKDINANELSEFAQEMGFKVKAERIENFFNNQGPKGGRGGKRCRSRTNSPVQKEETKAEDVEITQCTREGCELSMHKKQGHGFCCGKCKNGKEEHGNGCSVNVEIRQAEKQAARKAENQAKKAEKVEERQAARKAEKAEKAKVIQPADELELYQLALKLHQTLKLGSFDDCVSVVRSNDLNEAASIEALKSKAI